MATGDVTLTYLGCIETSGQVVTALTGYNTGAATVATSTTDLLVVPRGDQTFIFKMARAA